MPRIFAPNEDYNSNAGAVDFVNGAAAVPDTATEAIALFTAEGFSVDTNRNTLSPFDALKETKIREICAYAGVTVLAGDSKYQVIRKLEVGLSAISLGALTVASVAHASEMGKTTVTIDEAVGVGNTYYYKIAVAAPAPLYGDEVDSTWTACASPLHVASTTGLNITVVRAVTATGLITASGTDTVACKDA